MGMMNDQDDILTPQEVDRLFRYPHGRAVKLAKAGKLPAIFLSDGEIRFNRQTIADALASMSKNPAEGGIRD